MWHLWAQKSPKRSYFSEPKNFCFITFDKEDTAKKLLKEGTVNISGHELEIKKVNPPNKGMQGNKSIQS